jgi:dihydrofolate synthase/folylpolyglutamate synthase
VHGTDAAGVSFDLDLASGARLSRLQSPLPGRHQAVNAGLAASAAMCLARHGVAIGETAIRAGLATVRWPGRLETIGDDPGVLLDGAHNRDSAEALADFLAEAFPGTRLELVLGILADKDAGAILGGLRRLPVSVHAAPCPNPRTLPAEAVAAAARRAGLPVAGIHRSVSEALESARRARTGPAPVVVTGSLYAVAEARAHLLGRTIAEPSAQ